MLNKMILQGRLTAAPVVKKVGGDIAVSEFTIAWSEKYKETEKTLFMRCKAWRATADFLEKYFSKGQEILVDGKMLTEEWEKDGKKQSRTICNVENIHFCGAKNKGDKSDNSVQDDTFMAIPDGIEDELPFS